MSTSWAHVPPIKTRSAGSEFGVSVSPSNVLLRPSAPITTSKWKSETGWLEGWSWARHPEPEGEAQGLSLKSLGTVGTLGKVQPQSRTCQQPLSIDFRECDRCKYLSRELSDDFPTCLSVSDSSLGAAWDAAAWSLTQITACLLTIVRLLLWWLRKPCEFHIDVDLHSQNETHLQKHQLELADTWGTEIEIGASRAEQRWMLTRLKTGSVWCAVLYLTWIFFSVLFN